MASDPVSIALQVDYSTCVNFAMQQNDVPLIRALRLQNQSTAETGDLTLRIEASPAVCPPLSLNLGRCPAGAGIDIPPDRVRLQLLRDRLVNQEERERGELRFDVHANDGTRLLQQRYPVDVLAYNEWDGVTSLHEILAAFIMPNHPAVGPLVRRACEMLDARTGESKIAAYQNSVRERVLREVGAVYDALGSLGIAYVNPPPSFESTGQKIRTPDQVLEHRLGTCLDMAVLLCACLEHAGMAPFVLLKQGHAFAGAWLCDDSFETAVVPSGLAVKKRVDLGEIVVIEATGLCASPPVSFTDACRTAMRHLEASAEFRYALDVRMARRAGIRPMAARVSGTQYQAVECAPLKSAGADATQAGPADGSAAGPGKAAEPAPAGAAEEEFSRLERWKRKLLDLSRRNPLLNLRDSRRVIPLLCPNLAALEDALVGGEEFAVLPQPKVMGAADPRDAETHRERTGTDARDVFLQGQMAQRRLHALLTPEELERRMLEVSRADRLSLEESGANTLFMTLGSLCWYESDKSEVPSFAPIILVPMYIERRSVREGFRVRMLEDESRINVTLMEKLKADFGLEIDGLDPLPTDDAGLDILAILRRFREAVKNIERWEVTESASLSILTFTKFLMWLDLDRHTATLKDSPIVRHLLETPGEAFPTQGSVVPAEELDAHLKPADTYCPLDADSSQLAAILAAERGVSFVLQGPPGTGKSQTITNLIAHCMTKGKRVLFVSEKMAALEVVERRLQAVGLGPFCLELHSRKANKTDFRRQLEEALQVDRCLEPAEWPRRTTQLEEQRAELNAYVKSLHEPRPFGQSAYWAMNRMIDYSALPDVDATFGAMAGMSAERTDRIFSVARQLQTAAETAGLRPDHPLCDVGLTTWNIGLEAQAAQKLRRLTSAAESLAVHAGNALPPLRLGSTKWSRFVLDFAEELTGCLLDAPPIAPALARASDWSGTRIRLLELIHTGRTRDEVRNRLMGLYVEGFLGLPLEQLQCKLIEGQQKNPISRWLTTLLVRRILRKVQKTPESLTSDAMREHLTTAISLKGLEASIARASDLVTLFGTHWCNGQPDWDLLARQVDWVGRFRGVVARTDYEDTAQAIEVWNLWSALVAEQRDLIVAGGPLGKSFARFREAMQEYRQAWADVQSELQISGSSPALVDSVPDYASAVTAAAARWASNLGELRSWCSYQAARVLAVEFGMGPAAVAVESGTVPPGQLARLCEKAFARWCLKQILAEDAVLGRFFGSEHSRKVGVFRDLDEQVRELVRSAVFAQLSLRLPRQGVEVERFRSSEMGTIKRFTKGGRFTIRQAFAECPEALARLKPCVLMSPLSVAQFLGADFPKFDIVVFDEASQMPPWEAIGAIARGDQVIVVGDSKQLPPTSFFEKGTDDESIQTEDDIQDLESILDECVACQMPAQSLKWHYRSRHESLIAFSNHHYYFNELLSFPSAADDCRHLGVSLQAIEGGFYDASRSRTNPKEAEALVGEIVTRLSDPSQRGRSIGVVTFSIAQQGLVDDLLERARRDHPEIEPYFTDKVAEPVFVKNLETVQGDERDVILFSICYGPNRDGKVSMNFGPLNRKGGERRLNVAITRARQQLVVFSSLRPESIDLSRTGALGVEHLKAFLAFAARGVSALASAPGSARQEGGFESPFEASVCRALVERGWTLDTQVGCSGYRVDLAVRHPEYAGAYLMGIECDGATYHSAKTARDRDRLRHAVLTSLGWRMTRVWSTDWWLSPAKEAERLHGELARARQEFTLPDSQSRVPGGNARFVDAPAGGAEPAPALVAGLTPLPKEVIVDENNDGIPDLPGQRLYRSTPRAPKPRSPDEFYAARSDTAIASIIRQVMDVEAPIHADLLARRVALCWGMARISPRVSERVAGLIPSGTVRTGEAAGRVFLWRADQDPAKHEGFRAPDPRDDFAREAEHICPQEVANVMHELLKEHLSIQKDDLIRAAAATFGVKRVGVRVRQSMEEGLELYLQKQKTPGV